MVVITIDTEPKITTSHSSFKYGIKIFPLFENPILTVFANMLAYLLTIVVGFSIVNFLLEIEPSLIHTKP